MRKSVKTRIAKRAMALLLVVMMVCSTAVSAFALDGNSLMGDPNLTGGGDALISDGGTNNNSGGGATAAPGSLDYLLDGIPSAPASSETDVSDEESVDDFVDLENPMGDVPGEDASDEVEEAFPDSVTETAPAIDVPEIAKSSDGIDMSRFENTPYWWVPAAIEDGVFRYVDDLNAVHYTVADQIMTIAAADGDDESSGSGTGNVTGASEAWTWPSDGKLYFSGSTVGLPYIDRMSINGEVAFCGNYNTPYPSGSETLTSVADGSNPRIKQILANFDASPQDDLYYAAAQIAIWEVFVGSVQTWGSGAEPVKAAYDDLMSMHQPTDDLYYDYLYWHGAAQDPLITYNITTTPPPGGPPTGDTDVPPTEQNAYGCITIVKVDDDGNPLSGARFNIEITFADGSTGGVQGFEISNGQRTYWYNHPKNDIEAATVTVTEVEAPPGYVLDPTPQTFTVMPTYAISGGGGGEEGEGDDDDDDDDWDFGDDDDDDEGEGGGGGGGATVVMGDHPVGTFVNKDMPVTLEVIKYEKGSSPVKYLEGAHFHIEQIIDGKIDTDIRNPTWDVVTGPDGKITITTDKPGTFIVTETQAPANYKIIEGQNPYHIHIGRGQTGVVEVPNDKHGSILIWKRDIDDQRPLAGATFKITKIGNDGTVAGSETGSYERIVVTGPDGYVLVEDLEPGAYRVEEISPPPYYALSKNPVQTVQVLDGSHEAVVCNFFNEAYTGLRIIKVDAKTGKGLQGAVFEVYKGQNVNMNGEPAGQLIGNYQSDMNGIIVLDKLEPGFYAIYERTPPDGYALDENRLRIVEVTDYNHEDIIQVIFENQPYPDLRIVKKDALTGEVLEGAVFRVARQDGAEYNEYTTDKNGEIYLEKIEPGWYIVTEVRAPNGYLLPDDPDGDPIELVPGRVAEVIRTDYKKPSLTIEKKDNLTLRGLPNATFKITKKGASEYINVTTDWEGKAVLTDLEAGWYIIEEINAPAGYIPTDEVWTIEIKPAEDAVITIRNTKMPSLTIKKVDALTRQPLKNAYFEIYKADGELLMKGITDSNGEIYISRIDAGIYRLKETKAPAGYERIIVDQDINIHEGEDVEVVVENNAKEPLYIQKVDAKTGKPLEGAVFEVRKTGGEYVGEFTTGSSGFATVTGLDSGYYEITEIKAPRGYTLPKNPVKTVNIKQGTPATVVFEDYPLNGMVIVKIDADTGKPIPGVSFHVTTASGDLVGDFVTNDNGYFSIEDLEEGAYIVTEVEAASGYILDDTPHLVNLKKGETTEVTIKNTPLTGIVISKVDAVTGLPLAGAKFRVTTIDGKDIGEFITDISGTVTVPDLETGYYIVTAF